MSGIVGSTRTPLPRVDTTIPDATKPESRGNRLTRGLDHARILAEVSCVPSVAIVLAQ